MGKRGFGIVLGYTSPTLKGKKGFGIETPIYILKDMSITDAIGIASNMELSNLVLSSGGDEYPIAGVFSYDDVIDLSEYIIKTLNINSPITLSGTRSATFPGGYAVADSFQNLPVTIS